jgi:hypothetical protein
VREAESRNDVVIDGARTAAPHEYYRAHAPSLRSLVRAVPHRRVVSLGWGGMAESSEIASS